MLWWGLIGGLVAGYILGFHDGLVGKPPGPMKGNYQHCEDMEDQQKEYPDRWI